MAVVRIYKRVATYHKVGFPFMVVKLADWEPIGDDALPATRRIKGGHEVDLEMGRAYQFDVEVPGDAGVVDVDGRMTYVDPEGRHFDAEAVLERVVRGVPGYQFIGCGPR